MSKTAISFTVLGTPRPQGSKRGIVRGGKAVLVEQVKGLHSWRQDAAHAALEARQAVGVTMPTPAPVRVVAHFLFTRPKGHYSKPKDLYSHELRRSAPIYPGRGCGDIDKLLRALCDAITGVLFDDDSQVAHVTASREYAKRGQPPQAQVTVAEVECSVQPCGHSVGAIVSSDDGTHYCFACACGGAKETPK